MSGTTEDKNKRIVGVSDLPADELVLYGRELGLDLNPKLGLAELRRLVRERQELLVGLDREAMLDVAVWARRPVRESASKEELAKQITSVTRMTFEGLSDRGLHVLARLRGVPAWSNEPRALTEARLKDAEPFWQRLRRRRREIVAGALERMISGGQDEAGEDYQFLPEEPGGQSLRESITEGGIVGGIAQRLRGVADDYVRQKLDEIEARIDKKLDEIDHRLGEWRDKEIANRLRIIKITLVASVIVAVLSLGYNSVRGCHAEPRIPPSATLPAQ